MLQPQDPAMSTLPYQRLAADTIVQAVRDLGDRRYRDDALAWLNTRETSLLGYGWCLGLSGANPNLVRAAISQSKPIPPKGYHVIEEPEITSGRQLLDAAVRYYAKSHPRWAPFKALEIDTGIPSWHLRRMILGKRRILQKELALILRVTEFQKGIEICQKKTFPDVLVE